MVTLSTASNVLKDLYLDVIVNQLNTSTNPFYNMIASGSEDVQGKSVISGIRVGINGGIGSAAETGTLPLPYGNVYKQLKAELKNIYGTIEISDKAIRASQNSSGALVNILNAEMEGLLEAAKFNFGRMLFQKGDGVLSTVGVLGEPQSTSVYPVTDTRNFIEGMLVDFTTSSAVKSEGHRIIEVDRVAKTITLSPIVPVEAGVVEDDYITLQQSLNSEIFGLPYLFDTSETLFYGTLRSNLNSILPSSTNIDGALTTAAMQTKLDEIEQKSGNNINLILASYDVRRKYLAHLQANRLNVDYFTVDGGFKAISYNGIPLVVDRFVGEGEMYMLNTNDFKLQQLCDWKWIEGEGGSVLRQLESKPCYQATLVKYANLICVKPAGQGMLKGIADSE